MDGEKIGPSDLWHLREIGGALRDAFQNDVARWLPNWCVGFWHFLVWIDQSVSMKIGLTLQKFGYFPDMLAIEYSVAVGFAAVCVLYWRRFLYVFGIFLVMFCVRSYYR